MPEDTTRRNFLQAGVAAGVALSLAEELLGEQDDPGQGLPTRPLGKTGERVSILCLGGWHIGKAGVDDGNPAAIKLMHQAIDEGDDLFRQRLGLPRWVQRRTDGRCAERPSRQGLPDDEKL